MSIAYMLSRTDGARTVGSILHGAYGDYYEQMICLRELKRLRPNLRQVLFFESDSRRKELAVFDLSFADEIRGIDALATVPVDRFMQFQVLDQELNCHVLSRLPADLLAKFDRQYNLKPWSVLGQLYRTNRPACDLPLSPEGHRRLPECLAQSGIDPAIFRHRFTVGFLWRHRKPGDPISTFLQAPEDVILRTKSELLTRLVKEQSAVALIAGMNVRTTEENRERTDCKFTEQRLAVPSAIYLKGASWGLELEIMRQCSLCLVMASGFSEALLMKRTGPTILLDPPPVYIAKLLWNRMPLFDCMRPRNVWFYLRQPHTANRVLKHLSSCGTLGVGEAPVRSDGPQDAMMMSSATSD